MTFEQPSTVLLAPVAEFTESPKSVDIARPDLEVVLRSSDEIPVDFRVPKTLLIIASPFFASLLAIPQPPLETEEMSGGSPVIHISESGATIERLLPFCYPRFSTLPQLNTIEDIQSVLEIADKYDMRGVERCLGELLVAPRFLETQPIRVFATACRYGLEEEARLAAKHTLRLSLSERHYVPEMEHITAGALQRLIDYYFRCSHAASTMAKDFSWIDRDSFTWFDRDGCSCSGSTYILISGGTINLPARTWWLNYMRQLGQALKERPSVATIMRKELMEEVFENTKGCACGRKTILDMLEFRNILAAELEHRISEVELVLKF